jgi:hypothetical protein
MTSYPIPNDALDDRLAFVGTSGSGKTYAAGTAVERLLDRRARVVVVDPLDVWYGLRLGGDGKTPAFPVVIFGGAHQDLPINEHSGALLGETVATMAESCIVALAGLPTKSAERRFMLAFLEALYRRAAGEPFHIVFDEADLWAPQKSSEPALQGLMEQIVRRGRVKGFIPWLITQRPAVLSKDVLSQADGLVAMKLTASQDRDALAAWIEGQADVREGRAIRDALPTKQRGEAVVWLPARGVLRQVTFPPKATFDSSRTPRRGEKAHATTLRPLDIPALRDRLATVEAEVAANDPAKLKARIRELERKVAAPAPARDEVAIGAARAEGYQAGYGVGYRDGTTGAVHHADRALEAFRASIAELSAAITEAPPPPSKPARSAAPADGPTRTSPVTGPTGSSADLPGTPLRLLTILAQHHPVTLTRSQLALMAGIKARGGNWNTAMARLRPYIEERGDGIAVTPAGIAVVGEVPPAPQTAEERIAMWRAKLPGAAARILDLLVAAYPRGVTKEDIGARLDLATRGGNWNTAMATLRRAGLVQDAGGGLRAHEDLWR